MQTEYIWPIGTLRQKQGKLEGQLFSVKYCNFGFINENICNLMYFIYDLNSKKMIAFKIFLPALPSPTRQQAQSAVDILPTPAEHKLHFIFFKCACINVLWTTRKRLQCVSNVEDDSAF